MADSPASSLTTLSDTFTEELKPDETEQHADSRQPPLKRQRVETQANDVDIDIDLSSDTSGDVPASPSNLSQLDDEAAHEQVTVCRWEDCDAGDLGDMDKLVVHIHDTHIRIRQRKYSCEWYDCIRKGMGHASGYALRAHMRSHTREKPFFCSLPECDRSFTRSDALAKHMRTVHETEALRPSDPIPKSHSSAVNPSDRGNTKLKLKLTSKPPDYQANGVSSFRMDEDGDIDPLESVNNESRKRSSDRDPDKLFENSSLNPRQQYRLLKRQYNWELQEQKELEAEIERLTELRKKEWLQKELLIDNVLEAEIRWQGKTFRRVPEKSKVDVLPEKELPLKGPVPWYRQDSEEEEL